MPPTTLRKLHPTTGELLAEVPCTPAAEVPRLVAAARRAGGPWGALTPRQRGRRLRALAAVIAERSEDLCQQIARETGKPAVEAMLSEVFAAVHTAAYFGRRAAAILRPQRLPISLFYYRRSELHFVPRGVIGIISPWNFPFSLPLDDVVMALCAGNGVVLKPSEHTPLIALQFPDLLAAADIDPALVQVAVGGGDVGDALVRADVQMVHFTGSVGTGRKIGALCGERLVPATLELGGKDAAVILDDADLEHAARTVAFGAFCNAGQVCASVERAYVVGDAYAPFVRRVTEIAAALRQGDGSRDEVDVGPMIVGAQIETVRAHVEAARAAGATVRTGGQAHGPYFAPTVLTEVDESMAVCREESFGPLLPVMQVHSVDEAVQRANGSAYGLSAYVFSGSSRRGRAVAARLQAGTVMVNDVLFTHAVPETPWGGVKQSGVGFTHADAGVRHMCEARHINYGVGPRFANLWLYPYRRALLPALGELTRALYGRRPWPRRLAGLVRGLALLVRALRQPLATARPPGGAATAAPPP